MKISQKLFLSLVCGIFLGGLMVGFGSAEAASNLYKMAKKEGKVSAIGNISTAKAGAAVCKAFTKRYPGIACQFTRLSSGKTVARIEAERMAGRVNYDVVQLSDPMTFIRWAKEKFLMKHRPPGFDQLAKGSKDPDGYWAASVMNAMVWAYNPTKVKESDLPDSMDGFLDEKWKGKIVLAAPSKVNAWFFLWNRLAESQGMSWFKRLAKQDVMWTPLGGAVVRNLVSGERVITFTVPAHRVHQQMARKRPIKIHFPKKLFLYPHPMGVLGKAPHPNAGKLLVDYMHSKEGQAFLGKNERAWPSHSETPLPPGIRKLNFKSFPLLHREKDIRESNKTLKKFRKALGLPL